MAEGGRKDEEGRYEGGDAVLSELRQQSSDLCRVSAAGVYDSISSPEVEVEVLRRLREQLKQQKFDLQNRIFAGETSVDERSLEHITEDNLKDGIKQLVLDTENAKVSYYNKSLLLQRMQVFNLIQNKLHKNIADSELIKITLNHSSNIVSQILKEKNETQALEKQLIDVRVKRMVLRERSAALMTEVLSLVNELRLQKEPKEQKLKKIYHCLQKEKDATFMLQNIFQRLVHASRVNWVADPKLKEAVIKAGKNLHTF